MSPRVTLLILLALTLTTNARAEKLIPISELQKGGLPKRIGQVTLKKSGTKILIVKMVVSRMKSIYKLLDFETGQPVTFQANQIAITAVADKPATLENFRQQLDSANNFLIKVHPIRDKKLITSEARIIVVITSKGALDTTSEGKQIENAFRGLLNDSKKLLVFQKTKVRKLADELDAVGNSWVKFHKRTEIVQALEFVERGRNRIESLAFSLSIRNLCLSDADRVPETFALEDEIDAYVAELKIYSRLYKELKRKEQLAEEMKRQSAALIASIEAFQQKQRERRTKTINSLIAEFEVLTAKADLIRADQEFQLDSLLIRHSIREQEIEEYRQWLEAEQAAEAERVAQEYYDQVDYGSDWNNFQLMHQTDRMMFNSFYSNSWDHRPATDGRQ
ncbi:hypothetical protein [Gimesia fumaroli]|nr:hypothetical protein [Gimesia fumaroli]